MADVITRFKLETSSFDSKLRDTAKALQGIAHQAQFAGKDFNDFSQKSIEAARALGTVASGATNTKDKLKDLVGSYNDAAKAYNSLSDAAKKGEFGQALSASLQKLQRDIKETKEELYGLGDASRVKGGGGGLFGEGGGFKDMLSVFGGNMLTKAAEFAANLGSEVVTVLNESSNLAREAEGVRIAFERLGRGDLLDGLRDATHGTVSDFELMKAAVKFDDFKLPLDELGTMLAFAQKKAKDTGQSVDYMVDSIVTGLGRKSLMILDNLGLSANEVKNKMKETGDMTKAVGEIIREQMAKAGEYVDTAADKSSRANAELQNQMVELGRLMQETFGYTGWSDFAAGIKTEVVGALNFTIETILRAKQTWNDFLQFMGIQDKPQKPKPTPPAPNGTYFETTDADGNLINAGRWLNGKRVVNTTAVTVTGNAPDPNKKTKTPTTKTTKVEKDEFQEIIGLIPNAEEAVKDLQQQIRESWDEGEIVKLSEDLRVAEQELQRLNDLSKAVDFEKMFPDQDVSSQQGSGLSPIESMKQSLSIQLAEAAQQLDETTLKSLMQTALQNGIDGLDPDFASIQEKMREGMDIPDSTWEALQTEINEKLKELGIDPITIDLKTGKVDTVVNDVDKLKKTISTTAQMVGTIGQAFNAIEDPAAKVSAIVAQSIANIALAYSDALAKDTSSKFNIWGFIAASAASMISMATAISQIHSSTGYERGGIVKGNSYSGDNIMANGGAIGLNAGELVLNKAQQSTLASELQNGGNRIQVIGRLSGEQLFLCAENWAKRTGKGEFVTW